MSLPAQILDSSRFCRGRINWATFEEEFVLALESYGLLDIAMGTLLEPTIEPVTTTVVETRDAQGNVTGTTVTTREVNSTPLGSKNPTKADYRVRERKTNHYIMTHIIDSKGLGCDPKKHASENWKIAKAELSKASPVEMVMARERLTGLRLTPTHENVDEYLDYVRAFKDAHRNAVAAGNKFEDGVLRNMFIESLNDDHYLEAAGAIPDTATLDQAIVALNSTWWVRHRRRLQEIQQTALVASMMATATAAATPVAAAASNVTSTRTRTRTRGNRGTGPCTNGNHGPPGDRPGAAKHDLAHCWEDGGGDVANRPASYRPRNYLSSPTATAANSVIAPNIQVQSAAVSLPQVFILSAQVPSLQERLNIPPMSLPERMEVDETADTSGNEEVIDPIGPLVERISDEIADNDEDEFADMPELEDISDSGSDIAEGPLTQRIDGSFGLRISGQLFADSLLNRLDQLDDSISFEFSDSRFFWLG
ncbi:hypothetical protein C8J56DRAFT_897562 [Mycena floridula]|nr:hypothetical protein C8J56DRAFT_897562 [Mycena floridula]